MGSDPSFLYNQNEEIALMDSKAEGRFVNPFRR